MGNPSQDTLLRLTNNQTMKHKKALIAIAVLISIAMIWYALSGGKDQTSFHPAPNDTTKTALLYIDKQSMGGRLDVVFRISKDTSYLDSIAPGTFKQVSRRDSFYYVPVYVAGKDSTGQVIKDSTGKPIPFVEYHLLDKGLALQDYNKKF